jgi:hypothetical protein
MHEDESLLASVSGATVDHIHAASITALKNQRIQSDPRTALSKIGS